MKTLVITDLAPTVSNPNSGIFIVRKYSARVLRDKLRFHPVGDCVVH